VVLETGNPVAMPWANKAKAIVEAWYPGQAGGQALRVNLS
jgi:beta-glucosidase